MSRRLPPLNALRAFEAAARHLSFTRAAAELHVTQTAISHQIKALEERLGVRLFRRLPRLAPALPLLRMGGWMSVSGMMTQALIYADRFLIGALLSLAAVAYYATPLDLVLRAWILPVAVAQTTFG